MEIQSALNSGFEGFQKATETANEAARNIVAQTAASEENSQKVSTEASASVQVQKNTDAPSINQSIVDLKVSEYQAKASAEVISTADENLGTLLDVRV